ncbi:DUF4123 domain-containing protein [Neorhizobium alkalisoli]|uniref:Uncharacterized protein DUF4123 n=1 Tax=Neorhizobium alkalisoli TaxID=528178 RepID=A0A561QI90_9HYPH|nr:DUF4123 domain-containing protein [Neorhizobium alkalisoli]TWF50074.1 uncharacterized protein DUF4123 [Neorhizobium alkalisoli]
MTADSLEWQSTLDVSSRKRILRQVLDEAPAPLFAVIDGAYFDDLETELASLDIVCKSLFLDGGDPDLRKEGPWIIALTDEARRSHVEILSLEKPCVVFWSCQEGERALVRHLRRINQILVPDDRQSKAGAESRVRYERVLFRHWDPNVLGIILPVLDRVQYSRLLGPADIVVADATYYGGLRRGSRPNEAVELGGGVLQLRPDQIDRLSQAMADRSRRRTLGFLREYSTPQIAALDDEQLIEKIKTYERQAGDFGIDQHRARMRFSWLMIAGNDRFLEQRGVSDYLRKGPGNPNQRMNLLAEAMAEASYRRGAP